MILLRGGSTSTNPAAFRRSATSASAATFL